MPYKIATINLYGYNYALLYEWVSTFDLARFTSNLDTAINRVKEAFRNWFGIDIDTTKVIDLNTLKSEFDTRVQQANIPETSVPWWVREKGFMELQFNAFIKPLSEQQPSFRILSKSDDPYIPGLSLFDNTKNLTIIAEPSKSSDVMNRGRFNVRLSGSTSDSFSVPNSQYLTKAYQDFILDIDSLFNPNDTIQWLSKILAWMDLPALDPNTILQGFVFTKSWNGKDPFHFKFIDTGGLFGGAYGMKFSITTDKDTDAIFTFRDINDYRNELGSATVSLKAGTQTLTLQGDGFLGRLPSFASTIKIQNKDANVKIDEIRPLSLWEAILSWLGLI